MNFACDRCGRRYSVPDERVQGRAFRVTCKACGNVIQVRPGGAPATAAIPAPPRPALVPAPVPERAPVDPAPRTAEQPIPPIDEMPPIDEPPPAEPDVLPPRPAEEPMAPFEPTPPGIRARGSERGLSASEMAWMSDGAPESEPPVVETLPRGAAAAAADPFAGDAPSRDAPGAGPRTAELPPARERGPGLLRVLVAGTVLGLVVAGGAALLWPRLHPAPPPAAPKVAAAPAKPAPPPAAPTPAVAVDPAPAPVAPPPAAAPAPSGAPGDAPPPARAATSRASFEPGTVTVARVRRTKGHTLSTKDRKLLDLLGRKKDSAAPPEPVEALELDTARSLDPAAVERVVAESQGAFSGCISRNARPGQEERATLLLTVEASGAVSSAWIAEADVSRSGLGRCLATAGRRLVFPAFEGAPVDVSVPLHLEAR